MQHPINPGIYNGGAVVFNATPFANFFVQQQNKKHAEEKALNDYYNDQAKAITPTGMRAKDIEYSFAPKLNEWQKFGIENRKKLLNPQLDNYKSLNEFNRQKNELLGLTQGSKEQAKYEDLVFKAKQSGRTFTDEDEAIMKDLSLPVGHPEKRGFTPEMLSINRPPFDPNKFLTGVQLGMKRGKIEDNPIVDAKRGLQTINFREEFRPSEIKAMAEKAPFLMETDQSAKDEFSKMLKSEQLPVLQEAYEKFYPGDIVNTPEKAAKAFSILNTAQPTGIGSRTDKYVDPNNAYNQQERLIRLRQKLKDESKAAGGAEQEGVMTRKINDLKSEAKRVVNGKEVNKWKFTKDGVNETLYELPATPDILESAMRPGEGKGGVPIPDKLFLVEKNGKEYIRRMFYKQKTATKDGKTVADGFQKDSKGRFVVDKDLVEDIPISEFKDSWGKRLFSGKILHGELSDREDESDEDNEIELGILD